MITLKTRKSPAYQNEIKRNSFRMLQATSTPCQFLQPSFNDFELLLKEYLAFNTARIHFSNESLHSFLSYPKTTNIQKSNLPILVDIKNK